VGASEAEPRSVLGGLRRSFASALKQIDRRFAFTRQNAADDEAALGVVRASGIFRRLSRIGTGWSAANERSWCRSWVRSAVKHWQGSRWSVRVRVAGVCLVTAAAVHVALNLAFATSQGWLWLVIPLLAASIGVLFIGVSLVARHAANGQSL
jgi:hypothetical protein